MSCHISESLLKRPFSFTVYHRAAVATTACSVGHVLNLDALQRWLVVFTRILIFIFLIASIEIQRMFHRGLISYSVLDSSQMEIPKQKTGICHAIFHPTPSATCNFYGWLYKWHAEPKLMCFPSQMAQLLFPPLH